MECLWLGCHNERPTYDAYCPQHRAEYDRLPHRINGSPTGTPPISQHLAPWSRIGSGAFMLGRYRDGLEAYVIGHRGDWAWRVDRRSPPTFLAEPVSAGQAATKIAAQLAAQTALKIARKVA